MNAVTITGNGKWARRLDWWERILSVAVVPVALVVLPAVISWVRSQEEHDHAQDVRLALMEQSWVKHDQANTELLRAIESLRMNLQAMQVDLTERLARIEALKR